MLTVAPTTTFEAPEGGAAPAPAEYRGLARDHVRLLVAGEGGIEHARFDELPRFLDPGDLIVVNNSATVAGQVDARLDSATGIRPVVVHLATQLEPDQWVIELRSAPDAAHSILDADAGDHVDLGPYTATLLGPYPHAGSSPTGQGNRLWRVNADGDIGAWVRSVGRPISYGYLDRTYPLQAYQSVFSTIDGSAEMPSAGRPFTEALVTESVTRGIGFAPITLHTGVSSQEAGEGPQVERFEVTATTAAVVNETRRRGGRVVAVGTTVTRALESVVDDAGVVHAGEGWTDRVISRAEPAQVVDGLITGWHDPHASHLLLVESIAGSQLTQAAYAQATSQGYLWHEFGDSGLFLPPRRPISR